MGNNSVLSENELLIKLKNIDNKSIVSLDLEESIQMYLDTCGDDDYVDKYKTIRNEIDVFLKKKGRFSLPGQYLKLETDDGILDFDDISEQDDDINNDYMNDYLMKTISWLAEYIPEKIFTKKKGYNYKQQPEGHNRKPDGRVTFSDGSETYIEIKTVYCSFNKSGKLCCKVNSAMENNDSILNDFRYDQRYFLNKKVSIHNITTVFFFYYIDLDNFKTHIFKVFCVPAPLTVTAEFNSDGTFKKLGLKSNTNFNTTLSLNIGKPFNNEYNTLMDRAWMIATGYNVAGRKNLISNEVAKYYRNKTMFNDANMTLLNMVSNVIDVKDVKEQFKILKSYKYNTSKVANNYDKNYVKLCIKDAKVSINEVYGKSTVR